MLLTHMREVELREGNVVSGVVPPLAADGVVVVAVGAAEVDSGDVFFVCGVGLELIGVGVDLAGDEDVVGLKDLREDVGV